MDNQEERIKKSEEIRKTCFPDSPFFTGKPTFYLDMHEMFKSWEKEEKELKDASPR